jgi:cell division transport system permease protein
MAETRLDSLQLDDGGLHTRAWAGRHVQSFLAALGRLLRAPLASFMTAAVIGVALALPAALALVLDNVSQVATRWQGGAVLTVFMDAQAGDSQARDLAQTLSLRREVRRVHVTSPNEALSEYRQLAGDSVVVDALGESNPLPWMVVIHVNESHADPTNVERLASEINQAPGVGQVDYDLRWLNRLMAIMAVGQRGALVMALVLAFAVLLIIGNTIRLEIEHRRDEIEVLHLIGATNAFIRRPFLYTGVWYGLFGSALAAVLLAGALVALDGPVADLAATYGSTLRLMWPGPVGAAVLLLLGAALGALGAWVSVGRYLTQADELRARYL